MSNIESNKQRKKDSFSQVQENYQNSFGFNVKSLGNLLNQELTKDGTLKNQFNSANALSLLSGVKSMINGTNISENMNPQSQQKHQKALSGLVQKFR